MAIRGMTKYDMAVIEDGKMHWLAGRRFNFDILEKAKKRADEEHVKTGNTYLVFEKKMNGKITYTAGRYDKKQVPAFSSNNCC